MLQKETVDSNTLGLIKKISNDSFFKDFFLVGGTALSLQIGHRISIDIDLFSQNSFNNQECVEYLEQNYNFSLQYLHTNSVKGTIDGVFLDVITHNYPLVINPIIIENIKMLSKQDIAAMKVNAITGNGTRSKDYIDIYFLLQEFSFAEIISFYKKKYGNRNEFLAIKSLTYFNDISESDWPNLILEPNLSISKIKKAILKQRDLFLSKNSSL